MNQEEVKNFLKMMNIEVDDTYANELFESCDKARNGVLEGSEVEHFYKLVTARDEIDTIFGAYKNDEEVMTVDKLVTFMKKEQAERVSPEYAELLIQKYEPNEAAKADRLLTKDGFLMYLMSGEGNIFNQEHKNIYQNMSKPLNHYFISSSHNTYLMEDQLEGPSSTEAYIRY
uniref:1-phosphatidylinositol 4,5-bisphosphate phosphodiesterase delta-1-like n=1 Tax=Callorhinchus milii TaxID=7868 RepID=A0A4W3GM12_CALMI